MDGAMSALPLVFDAPRRGKPPRHLADLSRDEARAAVAELGQPAFRADQLARHYFRGVTEPAQMTDLPAAVRETLVGALLPDLLTPVRHLTADGGRTRKTLWRLHDGALVESVLMRYPDRATVCISSQAGCGMACPFCATGQQGLTRNLSAAEIIGQAVAAAAAMAGGDIAGGPGRLSNVVFMGMGEPLANYPRVRATLGALTHRAPHGLGLSQRSITVSTVGLVPAIRRLTDEGIACTLAVSLHAPDDELRDSLVPINTRWKVQEVVDAADAYAERTGRRYSVEYALIRDVNDQPFRADQLGRLLAGRRAHVNLIPLNPTPGSKWDASPLPAQREFVARLRAHGVPTTVRDTRGQDIDGACGQLAAADRVEGVPTVATTSSLAETVGAALGEAVVPLGAAPEDSE
jgi:23S rRNA (adenine2503-C2)-methyltransferase